MRKKETYSYSIYYSSISPLPFSQPIKMIYLVNTDVKSKRQFLNIQKPKEGSSNVRSHIFDTRLYQRDRNILTHVNWRVNHGWKIPYKVTKNHPSIWSNKDGNAKVFSNRLSKVFKLRWKHVHEIIPTSFCFQIEV